MFSMNTRSTAQARLTSGQIIVAVLVTLATMMTDVQSPVPTQGDATANLTEVKCVGLVINKLDQTKCQGTFLTQKHIATSCRCIGTTDPTTGVYTQGVPETYEVHSWSKGPKEIQGAVNLHFYYNCGLEPKKVIMDLGLIETAGPFSLGAVTPADLPDAMIFRFYEYIMRLQVLETRCFTSNLDLAAGSVVEVTVKQYHNCPKKQSCIGSIVTDCEWLLLQTNHICAVPKPLDPSTTTVSPSSQATTSTTANPTTKPSPPAPTLPPMPVYPPCAASAGAPLLCHKMLVGINGRTPTCTDPLNSHQFIRVDYTMNWLSSRIC